MSTNLNMLAWVSLAAQLAAWPTATFHQARGSLMKLPATQRATVERLIRKQLGPLSQGETTAQLNSQMQAFQVERIDRTATGAIAVQGTGRDLCGATGNCTFWIIDLHQHRIILDADAISEFAVDRRGKTTFPDVITHSHAAGDQAELIRWQFTGTRYQPIECATMARLNPDGDPLPRPKITSHLCNMEGN